MVFVGRVLVLVLARVVVLAFFINNLLPLSSASTSPQHKHKPRSAFLVHTPRFTEMSSTSSTTSLSAKNGAAAAAPPPSSCQASYPLGPEGTLPMPAVGLGTFQVKEEAGYEAVKAAIKVITEKSREGRGLRVSFFPASLVAGPTSHAVGQGVA